MSAVRRPQQVGPWAGCLGWAGRQGSQLGEAQIPQADKAACKHPARGGGRGQATRWQEKGETGAQALLQEVGLDVETSCPVGARPVITPCNMEASSAQGGAAWAPGQGPGS